MCFFILKLFPSGIVEQSVYYNENLRYNFNNDEIKLEAVRAINA